LRTRREAELGENVGDVLVSGVSGEDELVGDLSIGESARNQGRDFAFA
jgi:hypothetical protein